MINMGKLHTHYDNLKVARDAPPEVIRAAYKTLCHKFHPDRHGGSEKATQTFQLINEAYATLSDPSRRSHHDAWIAKREAQDIRTTSQSPEKIWNGRERRRRPSAGSASQSFFQVWQELTDQPNRPVITIALWASIGMMGIMLVLLFQS
jgi:DnaJ-class molecular chaperone